MVEHTRLIERFRSGDLEAFDPLVRQFQDYAVGTAVAFTGDFQLAEDVAQEAFIHAYLNLEQLRDPAAFPGWFRRIVLKFCDRHARKKRDPAAYLEAAEFSTGGSETPEEVLEAAESRVFLWDSIWELEEEDRELVVHFYMSGLPQSTIARSLGVSVYTVKNRLRAIRARLRERMMKAMQEDLDSKKPSRDTNFEERVFKEVRRISPASLTVMMQEFGVLSEGAVTSVTQEVEKETHYSGSDRLLPEYSDDATGDLPRALFLKTGTGNEEYLFYKHLASSLDGNISVACYGAKLPPRRGFGSVCRAARSRFRNAHGTGDRTGSCVAGCGDSRRDRQCIRHVPRDRLG